MQISVFTIMSLAVTSVRCFSISRRVSSSLFSTSGRSFSLDATKFNTADLQSKLLSPMTDGVNLIQVGIATTSVKNSQSLLSRKKYPINKDRVKHQIAAIKEILGVPHFQVDVWFCSDKKISEMNGEWREKATPTDILSFPANDFESPGVFADDPSIEFQKHLGDLVVAPNYVMEQCKIDQIDFENGELFEDDDAGVSKEMATKFTLEERIPLLFIHGMLHLLGYDHETDEDFAEMTVKEEEVIAKFKLVDFDKLFIQ